MQNSLRQGFLFGNPPSRGAYSSYPVASIKSPPWSLWVVMRFALAIR